MIPAEAKHTPILGMIQCRRWAADQPYHRKPRGMSNAVGSSKKLRNSGKPTYFVTDFEAIVKLGLSDMARTRGGNLTHVVVDGSADLSSKKESKPHGNIVQPSCVSTLLIRVCPNCSKS